MQFAIFIVKCRYGGKQNEQTDIIYHRGVRDMMDQGAVQVFKDEYRKALAAHGHSYAPQNPSADTVAFGVAIARLTAELVVEKLKEKKGA